MEENNKIERITIKYHHITKIKTEDNTHSINLGTIVWDYSEQLIIDRKTDTIEQNQFVGDECDIKHCYHIGEGVSAFLDGFDNANLFSHIEGNPDDVIDDPNEEKNYTVEVLFSNRETKVFSGSYDKRALPDDWAEFMDGLCDFISFYGMGEILDSKFYNTAKRRLSDNRIAYVKFDDFGKEYCYFCKDETIAVGDNVIVPVRDDGEITEAIVTKIGFYSDEQSPYPIEKMKEIIGKSEEKLLKPEFKSDFYWDDIINPPDKKEELLRVLTYFDVTIYTSKDYPERLFDDECCIKINNPNGENIEIWLEDDLLLRFDELILNYGDDEIGYNEMIGTIMALVSNQRCILKIYSNENYFASILSEGIVKKDSDPMDILDSIKEHQNIINAINENGGIIQAAYWDKTLDAEFKI